jgi:hypothetical protein
MSTQRLRQFRVLVTVNDIPWLGTLERSGVEVERPESMPLAFEALSQRTFDVVVSRWSPRWSRWLGLHAPAPAFLHIGSANNASFLAAAGRGLPLHACPDVESFENVFSALMSRTRSATRMPPLREAHVMLSGRRFGALCDFAHTGLAWWVPFGTPLAGLASDRVLADLEVHLDGQRVLGPTAVRLTRTNSGPKGYLVAGTFVEQPRSAPVAQRVVTDATRIEALLTTALAQNGLVLRAHEPPHNTAVLREATIHAGHVISTQAAPALSGVSLVDVEFEVAAARFSFTGLLSSGAPVRLAVPKRLFATERRIIERRICPEGARLTFDHPLLATSVELPVVDFTPEGLGLTLSERDPALPIGLSLFGAHLVLDGKRFRVDASVRRLTRMERGDWRCGLHLAFKPEDDHLGFAGLWLKAEFPMLDLGRQENAAELMAFFRRTGTAPQEVDVAKASEVLERLHRAPASLYRSMVLRRNEAVVAHVGAIRRYRALWTVQHLTSAHPNRRVAFSLLRAGIEVCLNDPTADFVHGNYAVENVWSARAMGSGLSGVDGAGRWALPLRQLVVFRGVPELEVPARVRVSEAPTTSQATQAEALIASQESVLLMQAYEWQAAQWDLGQFSAEWRAAGLMRTRTALVAVDGERVVAVGLVEQSTPYLNLREDLSAARVWFDPTLSVTERRDAGAAMLVAVARWYETRGIPRWPLIMTPHDDDRWLDALALAPPIRFVEATTRRDAVHALSRIWATMAGRPEKGEDD